MISRFPQSIGNKIVVLEKIISFQVIAIALKIERNKRKKRK